MGTARHRSWSNRRGTLLASCPRAFYWTYYAAGDEDEKLVRFLARGTTPRSLAGTIVHRHLTIGLRHVQRNKDYPKQLWVQALAEYDQAVARSLRVAGQAASGRQPTLGVPWLLHHLQRGADAAVEDEGRAVIETSLSAFESSPLLAFLAASNRRGWRDVPTDTDDMPYFVAKERHGFSHAVGLRIYAVYDFALKVGDDFVIVDWKTGGRTPFAEEAARRQLAVYGLWALADGRRFDRVRLLPHWLAEATSWEPVALDREEIDAAIARIEDDVAVESALVVPNADADGVLVAGYRAEKVMFDARPSSKTCGRCPYRMMCEEGRAITGGI